MKRNYKIAIYIFCTPNEKQREGEKANFLRLCGDYFWFNWNARSLVTRNFEMALIWFLTRCELLANFIFKINNQSLLISNSVLDHYKHSTRQWPTFLIKRDEFVIFCHFKRSQSAIITSIKEITSDQPIKKMQLLSVKADFPCVYIHRSVQFAWIYTDTFSCQKVTKSTNMSCFIHYHCNRLSSIDKKMNHYSCDL